MKLEELKKLIDEAIEKCGKTTNVVVYERNSVDTLNIEVMVYDFKHKEIQLEVDD